MTNTRFDLIVFDFDGTLVQSAAAKRRAFYYLFAPECHTIVSEVLAGDPDGPRRRVIPAMVERAQSAGLLDGKTQVQDPIDAYGKLVTAAVAEADAVRDGAEALRWASVNAHCYIFSVTPHDELVRQLTRRGWVDIVHGVFGFPNHKPEVLHNLIVQHGVRCERCVVVGDGRSDAEAARANGASYLKADEGWPSRFLRMADAHFV